jgi:hypothetical protein
MEKYWIFINNQPDGPHDIAQLITIEGFNKNTMVCPSGECNWRPAHEIAEFCEALGISPPAKVSSARNAYSPSALRQANGRQERVSVSGDMLGPDYQLGGERRTIPMRKILPRRMLPLKPPPAPLIDWVAPARRQLRMGRIVFLTLCFWVLYPEWPAIQAGVRAMRAAVVQCFERNPHPQIKPIKPVAPKKAVKKPQLLKHARRT